MEASDTLHGVEGEEKEEFFFLSHHARTREQKQNDFAFFFRAFSVRGKHFTCITLRCPEAAGESLSEAEWLT